MHFEYSEKVKKLQERLTAFMDAHVYPNERTVEEFITRAPSRFTIPPIIEELKDKAKAADLWNLFLPNSEAGGGLSNLEYAPLCEIMGRSLMAPELFNCNFPDTGNMEVLERYGTPAQKEQWLKPLLTGQIRSAFAMTEPAVASSDATNIASTVTRDGDQYVVSGHKWYISGAGDPRCKIFIFLGKSDAAAARHQQHSMILVPRDTPGIEIGRPMCVLGFDGAPSGQAEVTFRDVRVPRENILLGEGRGFEIAQGRLGPGRIHHCMRAIGMAERALELMVDRALSRTAFGTTLAEKSITRHHIAESRMDIEQARLLTLKAAYMMDTVGNKAARSEIAQIKVVAPNMALRVIDRAIQVHGAAGLSQDLPLAHIFAGMRALRMGDGPDEVHREGIAKIELKKRAARLQ
jgi:acyl-CoA dehydrogenase